MMKVKLYKTAVTAAFKKAEEKALIGIGELMQDSLYENTNKRTGLLSNSWNYKTKDNQSGFGTGPIIGAEQSLGAAERVSQPPEKTVRIGSALSYAEPYNSRFKVMEKTVDQEQPQFGRVASAAYKQEIGT